VKPGLELEGGVYLATYLKPFERWLAQPDVCELLVNRPGELWVERIGAEAMERLDVPELNATLLNRLASQIARTSHQGVNRENPLLAASLPSGERVQVILPPATRSHMALAIRKPVLVDLSLETYAASGAFARAKRADAHALAPVDKQLEALLDAGDITGFLKTAVAARKTMLISGGTSSGKTTFLNALLKEIPAEERIITVEDTPELKVSQANHVGLIAVKGELGEARVDVNDLLQAALRLRPDRIILGELRGKEAATFLRAINTGHPGSFTTVHADTPRGALEQIALMVLHSGLALSRAETIAYVQGLVDVVVQLERRDGARRVSEILFDPER
jgi:type IV secretion system protein VirB11